MKKDLIKGLPANAKIQKAIDHYDKFLLGYRAKDVDGPNGMEVPLRILPPPEKGLLTRPDA